MTYATICSGINAPAVAWNSLGWQEAFCAEIEAFPCSVLKARHPEVPNLGDITKYATWPEFHLDLLCGGTPCQSFSLAGLRKGMDDPRGQLTRAFIGIAARYRPRWLCWENVPGVLSSNGGRDFAEFLGGLAGIKVGVPAEGWGSAGIVAGIGAAYGLAYRVLDTQFVRVDTHPRACPQRRERVFVVGHLGGCWQRAAAVLLERESLCGNPAPRRQQGQGTPLGIAPSLTGSGRGVPRPGDSRGQDPVITVSHTLTGVESDASEDGTGRGTPLVTAAVASTLNAHFGSKQGLENQHVNAGCPLFVAQTITADMYRSGGAVAGNNDQGVRNCIITPPPTIAFSAKDYGQDAQNEVSPTLRAGNEDGSHANGGVMPAVAIPIQEIGKRHSGTPMNGVGHGQDGDPMYTLQATAQHGVMTLAIRGRDGEQSLEVREDGTSNAILTPNGGRAGIGVGAVATFQQSSMKGNGTIGYDESGIAKPCKTQQDGQMLLTREEPNSNMDHGHETETYTSQMLRSLRQEIGEETFSQWGLGVLASFLPQEVLQSAVHGRGVRYETQTRPWMVNCSLSRPQDRGERAMQSVREAKREGCSPQGQELPQQLTEELGAYLSLVSQPGASGGQVLQDLRQASQRPWILRDALPAVQEVGRSEHGEGQPVHESAHGHGEQPEEAVQSSQLWEAVSREWVLWKTRNSGSSGEAGTAVRRLTVEECEFLQAFPRGYTQVGHRGRPSKDGPRYKALGNSMSTNTMRWIGQRIQMADTLP